MDGTGGAADPPPTKKESIRKRLQSGRRAAAAAGAAGAVGAGATGATATATTTRPQSASGAAHTSSSEHPMPSTTPVKLKKAPPPPVDVLATPGTSMGGGGSGGGDGVDGEKISPAAAKAASKWMSKAEDARNRLRRHRKSTSVGNGSELAGVGVVGAVGDDGASDVVVTASVVGTAVSSSAAAASTSAPASTAGSSAISSAAAKLAKLGSVTGVSKPRSSVPNFSLKSKQTAAEIAKRTAENAVAFEGSAEAGAGGADASEGGGSSPGVPVVHGLDEAEMVLRLGGSLASQQQLSKARASVARMTELLDGVLATSRRLRCEPQNVYGYLLKKIGQPTDAVSAAVPLEQAVGTDKVNQMVEATTELRSVLRIKVQDNNDLRLAATALRETTSFFKRLDGAAGACGMEPHALLAAQPGASGAGAGAGRKGW